MMARWATGVADIVAVDGATVTVKCPHCGRKHKHGRLTAGSRHAVAGCHLGRSVCREYAIPELRKRRPTK